MLNTSISQQLHQLSSHSINLTYRSLNRLLLAATFSRAQILRLLTNPRNAELIHAVARCRRLWIHSPLLLVLALVKRQIYMLVGLYLKLRDLVLERHESRIILPQILLQ